MFKPPREVATVQAAASSENCRTVKGSLEMASLGFEGEASSRAWEPGARRTSPGVGVVACTEGGRVNVGDPPARWRRGRAASREPRYKAERPKSEAGQRESEPGVVLKTRRTTQPPSRE